jgi:hypothetical protein
MNDEYVHTSVCIILISVLKRSMFFILLLAITLIALSELETLCIALCTTPYEPLPSFYRSNLIFNIGLLVKKLTYYIVIILKRD